ncbi:hypothetical protein ACN6MY_10940 [Peribacillus sp. B-H-3]|uniref:hypothetical protein n=1 Tax=Peribacillus sp. B-H-3 TaxID=3400420 RepID=UPI003B013369
MDAKLIIAIIASIFGVSGWATFFYNHITHVHSHPKITLTYIGINKEETDNELDNFSL